MQLKLRHQGPRTATWNLYLVAQSKKKLNMAGLQWYLLIKITRLLSWHSSAKEPIGQQGQGLNTLESAIHIHFKVNSVETPITRVDQSQT